MSAEPFEATRLGDQLDAAARGFCNDPRHVRVDDAAREVVLSSIFSWYAEDFEAGGGETTDWIMRFAQPPLAAALRRAREEGYATRFAEYDWSLNGI